MATIKLRDYLESLSSKGSSALNDKITILDSADGSKIKTVTKSDLVNLTFLAAELRDDFLEQYGEGTISGSIQVDHDGTTNFVANEHIDHSGVSITAGNGLTGGGDISTSRTIDVVSANNGIITNAGDIELDTTSTTFTSGVKSKLNVESVISSSAQIDGEFLNTNGDDVVSSSIQITITDTTGFATLSSSLQSTDTSIAARVTAIESFSSSLDSTYASDSELTAVSSAFDSTINSLNTADVSEDSSNKYYTDVRVKTKLTAEDVVSGSNSDVKTFLGISASDISDVEAFSQSGTYSGLRAQSTTAADVDLGFVTNESKATMFTGATLTGNSTAPSQSVSDNSTKIATTEFVQARITDIIGNAGSTLDTLGELSASLSEDSGALSTLTTTVGTKLAKASNLSDLQNAATARGNLGVDASGADNSTDVTLAGSYNYLTIADQAITLGQVDASADISNLTTSNVTEGTNLYYTDAKVKTKLNTETVVSSSAQITNGSSLVSSSIQVFSGGDISGSVDNLTVQKVQGVALTSAEATQISNIGSETISSTQWEYLGASDQNVKTNSDVTFNTITGSGIEITGVTNYNGLTIKAGGASRPGINFENVTQGQLGGIFGTEGNSLGLSTQGGIEYVIRNANGASGDHLFNSYNTTILKLDGATNASTFGGELIISASQAEFATTIRNVHDSSEGLLVQSTDNDTGLHLLKLQSSNGTLLEDSASWADRFTVSKAGVSTFTPSGGSVVIDSQGHITSTQALNAATAGGRFIGSSNRGVLGDIRIEQTTLDEDGGYIRFMTSPEDSTTPTEKMRIDEDGLTTFSGPGLKLNRTGGEAYLFFQKEGTDRGSIYGGANQSGLRLYGSTGSPILTLTDTAVESRENITLAEGKGITFGSVNTPVQSNGTGTGNTLDDYEEGTWTPALGRGGTAPTLTYNYQRGTYTKIGRQVTLMWDISATITNSGTAGQLVLIQGLPFTVGSDTNTGGGMAGYSVATFRASNIYLNTVAQRTLSAFAEQGNLYIRVQTELMGTDGFAGGDLNSAGYVTGAQKRSTGTITYFTD